MNADAPKLHLNSAAAYLRMSTEHQQYSTANQMEVILDYAKRSGIEIIKVYSDEGKSGLNVQGRNALLQMIQDVQSGHASFSSILVYDVSRWGRFQDADESAHYEYICRKAGVSVHYCAEHFVNDGSPISSIMKGMKRVMAGEYSRELSAKVFQAQCRLVRLGYRQGGTPGIGLRRMLIDENGERKMLLKPGERKSIHSDRVILVPGPKREVQIVRRIYAMFLNGKSTSEIAGRLNAKGILNAWQRPWKKATVQQVLTNENYIGNNIYNRRSFKLQNKYVENPQESWIRSSGVFDKIISDEQFQKVRAILSERNRRPSNEEILAGLRDFIAKRGRFSDLVCGRKENLPSIPTLRRRFGSITAAYQLIGHHGRMDCRCMDVNRRLRNEQKHIVRSVIQRIEAQGAKVSWDKKTRLLIVNDELRVSIIVCRNISTGFGTSRLLIRPKESSKPDITIAVRMDDTNEVIRDYYLLPALDLKWKHLRMAAENGVYLDAYRYDTLDYFFSLAERINLTEVHERENQSYPDRSNSHSQPALSEPKEI